MLLSGAGLFCLGVLLVLTRRNAIMALMGVELMLNAANLNFAAFGHQLRQIHGQMAVLFVMVLAAAEIAIGLAIVLNAYRRFKTVNLDHINSLKG